MICVHGPLKINHKNHLHINFRVPTFPDWQNSMIFPGFSKKFQVYFLNIFNVASNYFSINVYIKILSNQKYIISTVSQGSHISGLTKFHDISMIFIIFCKIPWLFQVFQVYYIFPGFPVNVGTLQLVPHSQNLFDRPPIFNLSEIYILNDYTLLCLASICYVCAKIERFPNKLIRHHF